MSHRRLVAFWNRFSTNRQMISASRRRQQSVLQCALEPLQKRLLLSQTTLSGFASYTFNLSSSSNTVVETPNTGSATTLTLNLSNSYAIGNSTDSNGGDVNINLTGLTGPILVQPAQVAISADNFQLTFDSTFKIMNLSDNLGNGSSNPNAVITADDPNNSDTIQLNQTDLVWSGPTINYGAIPTVDVDALASNQTIDYSANSETVNLTGDSTTTYNLGNLTNITSPLSITGGTLALSLAGTGAGTLTGTTLTGFGAGAPLTIGSGTALNLTLPNPGESLNIAGLPGNTTVHEKGDTVSYVGNLSASGNNTLNVVGGGTGTLNIDDSGDTLSHDLGLSATSLTGAGGNITFTGLRHLNVTTGNFDQTTISNTAATTATQVNDEDSSGSGLLNLVDDSGPTTLNANSGNEIEIQATGCATSANLTGTGNEIELNGNFADYLQPITATGGNLSSTLDASDSDGAGRTTNLAADHIGGAGMTSGGITYSGFSTIQLNGSNANDTLNINGTAGNATTSFHSGSGANVVNLIDDDSTTNIGLYGSSSLVNVRATNGNTTINNSEANPAIVNVGGANAGGGSLNSIVAPLTINGGNNTLLHVDDTESTATKTGSLSGSAITGFGMGAGGIAYAEVNVLKLLAGSGGDTIDVTGTNSNTSTVVRSGSGNATVNISATSGPTTIITNPGSNFIHAGAPVGNQTGGSLSNIDGNLSIVGAGSDTLLADSSGVTYTETGTLTDDSIDGLSGGTIDYTGISNFKLWYGTAADTLYVDGTAPGVQSHIHSGTGATDVFVTGNSGNTTLNAGTGNSTVTLGGPSASPLSAIGGTFALIGSPNGTLVIDDSLAGNQTGTLGATSISGLGLPAPVTYGGFAAVHTNLDAGTDDLTITGVYPSSAYVFNGQGNADTAAVDLAGNEPTGIAFNDFGPISINVQGNFTGNLTTTGSITSAHIGGNFASGAHITGQAGVGSLTVGGTNQGTYGT